MLQGSTIWKTVGIFFNEPTQEHYLKEISRKSGVAHTSVKSKLERLKEEGIINEFVQKKGSRNFPVYTANIEGENYKRTKRHYNRHIQGFSKLVDYLAIKLMPKTIVLFGSYARGEDTEDSDIDIFIESPQQEIELSPYEKELNRKIQLHFNKNFKSLPKQLKNNIINGVIVRGYLEAY